MSFSIPQHFSSADAGLNGTLSEPVELFDCVRLWLFDWSNDQFAADSSELNQLASVLNPRDRCRFERYRTREKRTQFLASRVAVRDVVRFELGLEAGEWNWTIDAVSGGPRIMDAGGCELVAISLSHSGTTTCVAVGPKGTRIGVDVEFPQLIRKTGLERLLIGDSPQSWYDRLDESLREFTLCQIWTIRESVWKTHGWNGAMSFNELLVHQFAARPGQRQHLTCRLTNGRDVGCDVVSFQRTSDGMIFETGLPATTRNRTFSGVVPPLIGSVAVSTDE